MVISANKSPGRRGVPRGFTLLELLLALGILGLVLSVAMLSVGSGGRNLEIRAAARQFVDIAEYAMDEAQFQGTDMGVRFYVDNASGADVYSYEWLQRNGNTWRVAPFDEDAYGRRELPEAVEVVLEIEEDEAELEPDNREQDREDGLPPPPQVIFYASGEAVPGLMIWVAPDNGRVLWEFEWDLLGRFTERPQGVEEEQDDS